MFVLQKRKTLLFEQHNKQFVNDSVQNDFDFLTTNCFLIICNHFNTFNNFALNFVGLVSSAESLSCQI